MTSEPSPPEHAYTATANAEIKSQVIHSVSWATVGLVVHEAISFVVGVILARLLLPEAYGLMGMVFVFLQFARLFSDLGIAGAVIQRKSVTTQQLSTLFWINLAAGLLITLIFILSAPLIAAFYSEPRLVSITVVIAFMFAVGTLNDMQTALLRRGMQFRRQALIDTLATLAGGSLAIVMAFSGYGVWSLVAQQFAATVMSVAVMWVTTAWKPGFVFRPGEVRDILRFGASLQGFKAANYVVQNIDNLLIGRFLDVATLGIYRMAYKYMLLINNLIIPVLHPVLVPALSRLQDERDRVQLVYVKVVQVVAFISLPLTIGLIVTADTFVLTVLGARWVEVIPLLRLLAVGALALPLIQARHWLVTALGRGDILLRWQVIDAVLSTALFFIGIQFGVSGVAAAFVARTYLLLYPLLASAGQLVGLSVYAYVRRLAPLILASLVMGGIVWAATVFLLAGLPVAVTLAAQVLLGGVSFLGLAYVLRLEALQDIIRLLRGLAPGAPPVTAENEEK